MNADKTLELFADHLQVVAQRWAEALADSGFDAAIVTAGESRNHFLDDQAPPLKLNPHFLQWCPSELAEGSALLIRAGEKARLYFLQADDYWHMPPQLPIFADDLDVRTFTDRETLLREIQQDALTRGNQFALIGDTGSDVLSGQDVNPPLLLSQLHFGRATKTLFELESMREATHKAVRGHLAAAEAFDAGASEFQINLAFLAASAQLPAELPYQSIVALNEHAGVLHYQHYDRTPPAERISFLIDAGGSHNGYAADITRTYAGSKGGSGEELFAELVAQMDAAQQALIATIEGPLDYLELHVDMHRRLALILADTGLVSGSPEAAFEAGLTETFLPHGLGHLIGLQTHDVGGQQSTAAGGTTLPPENYSALRLTRELTDGMPVTIEPGLYFIPQLLAELRTTKAGSLVNWPLVDSLVACGGIRIEDNIVLRDGEVENFTRDAFDALQSLASRTFTHG